MWIQPQQHRNTGSVAVFVAKATARSLIAGSKRFHSIDASSILNAAPVEAQQGEQPPPTKKVVFPKRKGYINVEPPPPSAFDVFHHKPENYFRWEWSDCVHCGCLWRDLVKCDVDDGVVTIEMQIGLKCCIRARSRERELGAYIHLTALSRHHLSSRSYVLLNWSIDWSILSLIRLPMQGYQRCTEVARSPTSCKHGPSADVCQYASSVGSSRIGGDTTSWWATQVHELSTPTYHRQRRLSSEHHIDRTSSSPYRSFIRSSLWRMVEWLRSWRERIPTETLVSEWKHHNAKLRQLNAQQTRLKRVWWRRSLRKEWCSSHIEMDLEWFWLQNRPSKLRRWYKVPTRCLNRLLFEWNTKRYSELTSSYHWTSCCLIIRRENTYKDLCRGHTDGKRGRHEYKLIAPSITSSLTIK